MTTVLKVAAVVLVVWLALSIMWLALSIAATWAFSILVNAIYQLNETERDNKQEHQP